MQEQAAGIQYIIFTEGAVMTDREKKKFYNSKEWKAKRIQILARDKHECQDCIARLKAAKDNNIELKGDDRLIRRAEEVHHIKELEERFDLRLDDDNLISLCIQCHNIRHGRCINEFVRKKQLISEEKW